MIWDFIKENFHLWEKTDRWWHLTVTFLHKHSMFSLLPKIKCRSVFFFFFCLSHMYIIWVKWRVLIEFGFSFHPENWKGVFFLFPWTRWWRISGKIKWCFFYDHSEYELKLGGSRFGDWSIIFTSVWEMISWYNRLTVYIFKRFLTSRILSTLKNQIKEVD